MDLPFRFSLLQLLILLAVAISVSFFVRRRRLLKSKRRICELENEMLRCHQEILELHKENTVLKSRQRDEDNYQYPRATG